MTDGKKDQLKRKKTLEYELRRLYRAGELTDQQIAELKEAEFPFDAPVRRTAKSVVRIDDGKRWPSCSAAEKELGITQGWMSDVCNMALRGKWVAIKNQFYCFESMYSPDMDLTEIRGLAGWIVNLETGEMFPTTTEAAKAAGTSRSVVLDHVKNKVKPQNKRFSYVRDWDGKVGRLVDLNVQMICLETDTIYHSYDEICAAIWSDGYGETRKEIVQKVGDAIRHGAVSGTAVLTDIDPGCRAELNGFKPYLDTRIEVFNGQKNVLAEAGKALSSGSLSAICDDYGMDYAVLNYGINDVGIQDLEESGFKPVYSDNLTVCLKRSTV